MRVVESYRNQYTDVVCLDKPGAGGACHQYQVNEKTGMYPQPLATIDFQNGGIQDVGVNGCMNEDLLAIVLDRLQGFQSGQFKCRENALAITKIEEALHWLNHRTQERIRRGVEGKSVV